MSGKPAAVFGIEKRGVIKPGNFADVFIFDAETIIDTATPDEPYQFPHGVEYVLVNGTLAYDQGKIKGVLAGQVLRKPQKKWYHW
jgi:N-acyl-D-amino-acid deacylase